MQGHEEGSFYCNACDKEDEQNTETHPLFVDPPDPDNAYRPYFEEFKGKRASNITAVENLVLCKGYVAVSKILLLEPTKQQKLCGGRF